MYGCQQPIEMPVCQHLRPIKFGCTKCYAESINEEYQMTSEPNPAIHSLNQRIEILEGAFSNIDHLIVAAQNAQALFAQKVHDLKSIDKKRDDVINALCQKVEDLSKKFHDLCMIHGKHQLEIGELYRRIENGTTSR